MANPYHDEFGRFCSKGEMRSAIDRLGREGKLEEYFALRTEFEEIEQNKAVNEQLSGGLPRTFEAEKPVTDWVPAASTETAGNFGPRTVGSKYDPNKSIIDIAKDVRGDIKQAVAGGFLPSQFKYSVRKANAGLMNEGLDVIVKGSEYIEDEHEERLLTKKLKDITGQYNSSEFAPQVDYVQTRFFTSVKFERN